MAGDKGGDGFVRCGSRLLEFFGAAGFGGVGLAGTVAEQVAGIEGSEVGGDHHAHAVGHGEELAAAKDIGDALGVVGLDDFVGEAEVFRDLAGPGFFGDPGVGAGFHDEAVVPDGLHDAAEAAGLLKQGEGEGGTFALRLCEFVGGGEAGDASAKNRYGFGHGTDSLGGWTWGACPWRFA